MRPTIVAFLLFLPLLTSACFSSATVGIGGGSGVGLALSVHGDALYGSGSVNSINREGLTELLEGRYENAETLFAVGLDRSPGNPDGVFYLGITRIYLGELDSGYDLLDSYRDRRYFRITQEVRYWSGYFRQRPETPPKTIHRRLNTARAQGFRRDIDERRDRLR